ncbi:glycosyltransferase [Rossellomorea vietnamensis]|uniref:glycosyltransferase n=1 Tax=Rossellomorea vietnamensis TaxID=218284 RepID=UPI0009A83519|nr:glycosyl transferase [Bacillus sp. DSM 27956]PRX75776.1 glycosyltransferase involved in cell wall biosynthesis [Bacillus sp. V-88]WQI94228.1 glycosyltransferase [Rossellomorea vietnamensis]SLK23425.1 Glycosyltransferase involved in cell wall bisynthesis [Bacillus sp. V-88]
MKKNILIAVYSMGIGGIEKSLINMLSSFDYSKYNVDLFVFDHSGELLNDIPEEVNLLPEIPNYSVFRRPIKQCLKEGEISTSIIRVVSRLLATVEARLRKFKEGPGYIQMQLSFKYSSLIMPKIKKEYEAVISYSWPHDIIFRSVKAEKKIAWIHTDYSQLEINHSVDFKAWKKFDYIVSISEDVTKAFLTQYPSLRRKIVLCENITSPEVIKQLSGHDIEGYDLDTFKILSVGRLSYVKGFDIAIKALKLVHEKGLTTIKWYVIGYGGYEEELKKMVNDYGLNESFVLLGKKTNPYPFLNKCDLFIQPSRYEGKAVTVTEAKILGKPILLTDYPTSRSQIEEGKEGIICDMNPESLADSIEELYKNTQLREGLCSYLRKQDFSNSVELKKLYSLLEGDIRKEEPMNAVSVPIRKGGI